MSSEKFSDLPELPLGWTWTDFESLSEPIPHALKAGPFGSALKKSFYVPIGYKIYGQEQVIKNDPYYGNYYIDQERYEKLKSCAVKPGDILISLVGTIGKVLILPDDIEPGIINPRLVKFSLDKRVVNNKFIKSYLESSVVKHFFSISSHGGTMDILNLTILKELPIPLPPLSEQHEIVAKIEELSSRLDAGINELQKTREKLNIYRQSVLKHAFEGKLTKEWRESYKDEIEPASFLLDRILKQRRRRWEEEYIGDLESKGKLPKNTSWKKKYKEPVSPKTSHLSDLPENWIWATWNQISDWVTYGFTKPMPHVEKGIPIVTAKNVMNSKIDFINTHKTPKEEYLNLSLKDKPLRGDILITKDGTIGRAAVVDEKIDFCVNQSVAVIWLRSCPINRKYLLGVIEAPLTQKILFERARGVAIKHISITDFSKMYIPLAPEQEQNVLIEKLEQRLSIIDEIEKLIKQNLIQAKKLHQSILKKAFSGQLIPQDPNNEPAEKLLEHIKAEKEKQKSKRKTRKKNKSKQKVLV